MVELYGRPEAAMTVHDSPFLEIPRRGTCSASPFTQVRLVLTGADTSAVFALSAQPLSRLCPGHKGHIN
jgi:hypothetical protein